MAGFYPVGGASRIAETILPRIRATGGEVFTYARVEEILLRPGRVRTVCGVRMADGSAIDCRLRRFVGRRLQHFRAPARTLRGPSRRLRPAARRPGNAQRRATSASTSGSRARPRSLGLPKNQLLDLSRKRLRRRARPLPRRIRNAPLPAVYISFPSAKDPDYARRRPAHRPSRSSRGALPSGFRQVEGPTLGQAWRRLRRLQDRARRAPDGVSLRQASATGGQGGLLRGLHAAFERAFLRNGSAANFTASTTTRSACSSRGCVPARGSPASGSPGRT